MFSADGQCHVMPLIGLREDIVVDGESDRTVQYDHYKGLGPNFAAGHLKHYSFISSLVSL